MCYAMYALHFRWCNVCQTHLYWHNRQQCICFSRNDFQVSRYAAPTLLLANNVGKHQRICSQTWSLNTQATFTTICPQAPSEQAWNCELFANKQCGFDAVCVGEQLANCSRAVLSSVDLTLEANAVRVSYYITHLC